MAHRGWIATLPAACSAAVRLLRLLFILYLHRSDTALLHALLFQSHRGSGKKHYLGLICILLYLCLRFGVVCFQELDPVHHCFSQHSLIQKEYIKKEITETDHCSIQRPLLFFQCCHIIMASSGSLVGLLTDQYYAKTSLMSGDEPDCQALEEAGFSPLFVLIHCTKTPNSP